MNILKKYKSLISILEDNEYSIDKQIVSKYCIDWRKDYEGTSEIILFPKSVEKISKIVSICSKKKNSYSSTRGKYRISWRFSS